MNAPLVTWTAARAPLDATARAQLAKLFDHPEERDFVAAQVEAGNWQMLVAHHDGTAVAHLVISTEDSPRGRVLLVNGLIGEAKGIDLVDEADTVLEQLARVAGCTIVRIWTAREGLKRKLKARDWSAKYVLERAANGFEQ